MLLSVYSRIDLVYICVGTRVYVSEMFILVYSQLEAIKRAVAFTASAPKGTIWDASPIEQLSQACDEWAQVPLEPIIKSVYSRETCMNKRCFGDFS